MNQIITEIAYAKINLTLSVGQKRPDGYHDIDSIMHSISLADTITLQKSHALTLSIIYGSAPKGKENLMFQAAELFFEKTGLSGGVHMTLDKRIPAEAGMGGGSSDAAAVLRGLDRLYDTHVSRETLAAWSASLGADIPFCVMEGAARCQGIGEKITSLTPWEGLPLVILRPNVSVSTGKAYKELDQLTQKPANTTPAALKALEERNISSLETALSNDFETGLFPLEPILKDTSFYLHSLSRPHLMTGSGSAFFVLAKDTIDQKQLADLIRETKPDWFVAEAVTVGKGK